MPEVWGLKSEDRRLKTALLNHIDLVHLKKFSSNSAAADIK